MGWGAGREAEGWLTRSHGTGKDREGQVWWGDTCLL